MKKGYIFNILTLLSISTTNTIIAQEEKTDTVMNLQSASRIEITETSKGLKVSAISESGEMETVETDYPSSSRISSRQRSGRNLGDGWFSTERNLLDVKGEGRSHWGVSVDGVCIGLNRTVGTTPEGGLQWSKSFEIGWLSCLNVFYDWSRSRVSLGIGFDWRNYKITTSEKCLVPMIGERGVEWGRYPEGARGRNSRIKIFTLQFPLLYEWSVPKSSLTFKVGPVVCLNTHASLKTNYETENGEMSDVTDKIGQRMFTLELFGSISLYKTVGLYVRYTPMKIMDTRQGVNFRVLTVGVGFGI